ACSAIQIAGLEPALDALIADFNAQEGGVVHRGGERLSAAHTAKAAADDQSAGQAAAEMATSAGSEGLVGTLENALSADVDPAAGRHLAEHRQTHRLQPTELFPSGPLRNQQAIGNQHARSQGMAAKDRDRLAGLNEERLIALQLAQGRDDGVEGLPAPGG